MDFRKVIKFGENSFVISLPNKWVRDNKIKKGDIIHLDSKDSSILISPHEIKPLEEKSEITLDYDKIKTFKNLKTNITAAYINGYGQINIVGKDVSREIQLLRELARNFIALEITEQTQQKVILREFLNIEEVSLQDAVRRIDRLLLSMMEDTEAHLKGEGDYVEIVKQKDNDIFRLQNFVFRVINLSIKNNLPKKIPENETIYYWELANVLEKIGNQIKRIPRYMKSKTAANVQEVYKKIFDYYKEVMKSNYTKNTEKTIELLNNKKVLLLTCEKMMKSSPKNMQIPIEKFRNAIDEIHHLCKTQIKHFY